MGAACRPERGRGIVLDREAGDCIVCHAMPLPQRQFHGTIGPPLDGGGGVTLDGADEDVNLELYMAWRGRELAVETPAVRRWQQ